MVIKVNLPPKIIRLPIVEDRIGFKKTTIYTKIAEGNFPRQIFLGKRSVGWLEEDINNWIQQRINESQKEGCR